MYSVTEGINFPGSLQAYASGWVGSKFPLLKILTIEANVGINSLHQHRVPVSVHETAVLLSGATS
jgi:hypothetical protein